MKSNCNWIHPNKKTEKFSTNFQQKSSSVSSCQKRYPSGTPRKILMTSRWIPMEVISTNEAMRNISFVGTLSEDISDESWFR